MAVVWFDCSIAREMSLRRATITHRLVPNDNAYIYIARLVTGQFATRTFAPPENLPKITIADVCSLLRIQSYRVSVQVYG